MRLFKDNGITAKGKILPLSEFSLFLDLKEKEIDPRQREVLLSRAERALEEPIPTLTLSDYRRYFWSAVASPLIRSISAAAR